jgi:hypothetical protein
MSTRCPVDMEPLTASASVHTHPHISTAPIPTLTLRNPNSTAPILHRPNQLTPRDQNAMANFVTQSQNSGLHSSKASSIPLDPYVSRVGENGRRIQAKTFHAFHTGTVEGYNVAGVASRSHCVGVSAHSMAPNTGHRMDPNSVDAAGVRSSSVNTGLLPPSVLRELEVRFDAPVRDWVQVAAVPGAAGEQERIRVVGAVGMIDHGNGGGFQTWATPRSVFHKAGWVSPAPLVGDASVPSVERTASGEENPPENLAVPFSRTMNLSPDQSHLREQTVLNEERVIYVPRNEERVVYVDPHPIFVATASRVTTTKTGGWGRETHTTGGCVREIAAHPPSISTDTPELQTIDLNVVHDRSGASTDTLLAGRRKSSPGCPLPPRARLPPFRVRACARSEGFL